MNDVVRFRREVDSALADSRASRDRFVALASSTSFAELVEGFDRIRRPLDPVRGAASLFVNTHPDEAMRDAARELEQAIAALDTEFSLDRAIHDRLRAAEPSPSADAADRRLRERALRDFHKSGVDRDEATRTRIRAISDELVRLGQEFEDNIISDVRSIAIPEGRAGLAGLPDDYVRAHEPDASGAVHISTDPSDYLPFITYANSHEHRRALYRTYVSRAVPKNLEVLPKILALRHEIAGLCGFANFAEYALEDRMVHGSAPAREFVERVADLARPRAMAEIAELIALKRAEGDPNATEIRDWERFYWIERLKSTRFGFDSQLVRPYFAYRSVRDGVLATSSALFGLAFAKNTSVELWHPSVECFDVVDRGTPIARFYLDMHPRPNKYKHAAMFPLVSGVRGERLPEAVLVCNFPAPTDDDPALLLHQQVTTFFHEFGHLMHHLLGGRQRHLFFSGIATEMDFIEVPSQMYEEWAWDTRVLQRFARHVETGELIPSELVQRLREAEEYGKALHVSTQMFYAALALAYHDRDPRELDLLATMVALKKRLTPFPYEEGTHFYASFGHLSGYAAGYYTYMWSLVIAKDLFSRFDADLMGGETSQRYRELVLEPGGSRDASDLVHAFLGRDYRFDAWQKWLES